MGIKAELLNSIDVGNTLGEGVIWRESDQTVWWTDIEESQLFQMAWPAGSVRSFELPERLGSFGAVKGDDSRLVCAFETGFALYAPETGEIAWLSRLPELQAPNVRMNDGKVGPDGSFWAGSMREGDGPQACETGFYRLAGASEARLMIPGLGIPNGLAWSPSGDAFYYADTSRGTVYRCEASAGAPDLACLSTFAEVADGAPDGAAVDMQGRYWSALWGAGKLAIYAADGTLQAHIPVPALQPTCLAFGGAQRNLIFVTSARDGLDPEALANYPKSGSLFVFRTNTRGLPANRYITQSAASAA